MLVLATVVLAAMRRFLEVGGLRLTVVALQLPVVSAQSLEVMSTLPLAQEAMARAISALVVPLFISLVGATKVTKVPALSYPVEFQVPALVVLLRFAVVLPVL